MLIPFHKPFLAGQEIESLQAALASGHLEGNGPFTRECQQWLERYIGCRKAFLTHTCTDALEMAALLARIGPGDEVILPSFTFVSTASAFALRGAVPVFVDIRADTLNLDETKIEAAITERTRAIVPVHYAGQGCEMPAILEIARRHGLFVIEDAAQAIGARCQSQPLGRFGQMAALSFHHTKNLSCGEGGALLVNDPELVERAEVLWQKGTNRSSFLAGAVDKYTWVEPSSSFLAGELTAAVLAAQLNALEAVTRERRNLWQRYHEWLAPLDAAGLLRRPSLTPGQEHNGHLYYVLVPAPIRSNLLTAMRARGIELAFHYVPLHDSPAGKRVGRVHGSLAITEAAAASLVRLPLWSGLSAGEQKLVVDALEQELCSLENKSRTPREILISP